MEAWVITKSQQPLEHVELETPSPEGAEVVIEVTHCGVCHSDLHLWKGEYNMGGGQVIRLADRGVELPRAPGHEIAGRVVAMGPDAQGVTIGSTYVVYPWIGCGECAACAAEQDNLCKKQRQLGVVQHGGFASHVKVPHARYLIDPGAVDPAIAATYACSGLTARSAVRKIMPTPPDAPVVVIGAGGVGLTVVAMLRALGHKAIFAVDLAEDKRQAAAELGAVAIDGGASDLPGAITAAAGGPVSAVIDCVNNSQTAQAGIDALDKGGRFVAVGVAGGQATLSLAGLILRATSIQGNNTGTLEDLRDVIALATAGKLEDIPIVKYPTHEANKAMTDLKEGRVTGRIVLTDV